MINFSPIQCYALILIIIASLFQACKSIGSSQVPSSGSEYEVTDRAETQRQDSLLAEKYALKLDTKRSVIEQSLALYKFIDRQLNTPCSNAMGKNTTNDIQLALQLYEKVYIRKIPRSYNKLKHSKLIPKFSSRSYLAEGDMVFFEENFADGDNKQINQSIEKVVAIYLHNDKFVTCSENDGAVAINDLNAEYWDKRYKMAGRLR